MSERDADWDARWAEVKRHSGAAKPPVKQQAAPHPAVDAFAATSAAPLPPTPPPAPRNTLACNDPARGRDMPKKSHLRTLAPELRDELDRLLRDGRHTIRQVTDHLRALGVQTSKSSVHEYSQEFERVMEDVRRT